MCGHRYYDSTTGRWLTKDPIGTAGGVNLYSYCGNNGIIRSDPSGLLDGIGGFDDTGWGYGIVDPSPGGTLDNVGRVGRVVGHMNNHFNNLLGVAAAGYSCSSRYDSENEAIIVSNSWFARWLYNHTSSQFV